MILMVYALAPGVKMACPTKVCAYPSSDRWQSTVVVFDVSNVAMADVLLGTVSGVQFCAVFQSLLTGLSFQVALLACAASTPPSRRNPTKSCLIFVDIGWVRHWDNIIILNVHQENR